MSRIYPRPTAVVGVWLLPPSVCLSVCPHDISETDAVRITKRDSEMFHDESWKPIYSGVKRSKVKITSHENIAGRESLHSCECGLLLVPRLRLAVWWQRSVEYRFTSSCATRLDCSAICYVIPVLWITSCLLLARLKAHYCFARWRLSSSSSVVCRLSSSVTLPAGGRASGPACLRARGRSGGRDSTAGQ